MDTVTAGALGSAGFAAFRLHPGHMPPPSPAAGSRGRSWSLFRRELFMGRLRTLSGGCGRAPGLGLAGDGGGGGSPLQRVSVVNPLHAPERAPPGARPALDTGGAGGIEVPRFPFP